MNLQQSKRDSGGRFLEDVTYIFLSNQTDFPRKVQMIGSSRFTQIVEITELIRKKNTDALGFYDGKVVLGTIHTTTLFFFTSRMTCILKETKKSF